MINSGTDNACKKCGVQDSINSHCITEQGSVGPRGSKYNCGYSHDLL